MKTCYVDVETRAIADLIKPGELMPCWTISRINVPKEHRGNGHASALLKRIIADADAEGVELALAVSPSDGLGETALALWYGRYGFKLDIMSGYMTRPPKENRT
jgi:GNAT superfamily N-acetyltransferase